MQVCNGVLNGLFHETFDKLFSELYGKMFAVGESFNALFTAGEGLQRVVQQIDGTTGSQRNRGGAACLRLDCELERPLSHDPSLGTSFNELFKVGKSL